MVPSMHCHEHLPLIEHRGHSPSKVWYSSHDLWRCFCDSGLVAWTRTVCSLKSEMRWFSKSGIGKSFHRAGSVFRLLTPRVRIATLVPREGRILTPLARLATFRAVPDRLTNLAVLWVGPEPVLLEQIEHIAHWPSSSYISKTLRAITALRILYWKSLVDLSLCLVGYPFLMHPWQPSLSIHAFFVLLKCMCFFRISNN